MKTWLVIYVIAELVGVGGPYTISECEERALVVASYVKNPVLTVNCYVQEEMPQ